MTADHPPGSFEAEVAHIDRLVGHLLELEVVGRVEQVSRSETVQLDNQAVLA